jgi:hypothetical protein
MLCYVMTQLRLKWTLRDAPRRILSKIVQYLSGHGLVGAWLQRIVRGEGTEEFHCPCGTLQTIQHILKECVLCETRMQFLRGTSPAVDREGHQGYREMPGLALVKLLFTGSAVDLIWWGFEGVSLSTISR